MMIGDIDFNELYYPPKMVIQSSKDPSRPFRENDNFTIRMQNLNFSQSFEEVKFPKLKLSKLKTNDSSSNFSLRFGADKVDVVEETIRIPVVGMESSFTEYLMPNLFDADVNTSAKPPFYPVTGIIFMAVFIYLVPVVMFNLLVGLAIDDVQVIMIM